MNRISLFLIFFLWFDFALTSKDLFSQEQKKLELSRVHNEDGAKLFKEGKFLEAAEEFEKAWEAYPKIEAVFNIALAYEKGGNFEKALFWYQEYLKVALPSETEKIEAKIKELEKKVSKKEEAKLKVEEWKKEKKTKEIIEKGDTEAKIKPEGLLEKKAKEISSPYNTWKWIATIGTFSFLGFGVGFNSDAVSEAKEANKLSLVTVEDWKKYHQKFDTAKKEQIVSYVFYGLSGAAAIASAIFWYLDLKEAKVLKELPPITFLPTADNSGGMIFVSF